MTLEVIEEVRADGQVVVRSTVVPRVGVGPLVAGQRIAVEWGPGYPILAVAPQARRAQFTGPPRAVAGAIVEQLFIVQDPAVGAASSRLFYRNSEEVVDLDVGQAVFTASTPPNSISQTTVLWGSGTDRFLLWRGTILPVLAHVFALDRTANQAVEPGQTPAATLERTIDLAALAGSYAATFVVSDGPRTAQIPFGTPDHFGIVSGSGGGRPPIILRPPPVERTGSDSTSGPNITYPGQSGGLTLDGDIVSQQSPAGVALDAFVAAYDTGTGTTPIAVSNIKTLVPGADLHIITAHHAWTAVAGAVRYQLYLRPAGGQFRIAATLHGDTISTSMGTPLLDEQGHVVAAQRLTIILNGITTLRRDAVVDASAPALLLAPDAVFNDLVVAGRPYTYAITPLEAVEARLTQYVAVRQSVSGWKTSFFLVSATLGTIELVLLDGAEFSDVPFVSSTRTPSDRPAGASIASGWLHVLWSKAGEAFLAVIDNSGAVTSAVKVGADASFRGGVFPGSAGQSYLKVRLVRPFSTPWAGDGVVDAPASGSPDFPAGHFPVVAWVAATPQVVTLDDTAADFPPVDQELVNAGIVALADLPDDLAPSVTPGNAPVGYPRGLEALQAIQAVEDEELLATANRSAG